MLDDDGYCMESGDHIGGGDCPCGNEADEPDPDPEGRWATAHEPGDAGEQSCV